MNDSGGRRGWVFALLAMGCDGGTRSDAGAMDASRDSGLDGSVDASADAPADAAVDAGLPHGECEQGYWELPRLRVEELLHDRLDVEYPMTVVVSSALGFRAEDGGLPAFDRGDDYVEVELPSAPSQEVDLPEVGDSLVLLGGRCDGLLEKFYVRLTTPDGRLLFEGGDPGCGYSGIWPVPPRIAWRRREGAETCSEVTAVGCCCRDRTEHEVILPAEADGVLVRGEDRVVDVDGERYLASSMGIFELDVTECVQEHHRVKGGAFLAPLATQ